MMKSIRFAIALLLLPAAAIAQPVGQLPSGTVWGNSTASRAPASPVVPSDLIDRAISSTQGAVMTRNATGWIGLVPGTAGLPLLSGGAGANLAYGIPALAAGGTGANLTASNGGIFYSTGSIGAILSGTSTARQMVQSGASGAPAWSTTVWPATTASGTILVSATANTVTATSTPTITGGSITGLTALGIRSTGAAFDILLASNDATLTANRTINFTTFNGSRNVALAGDISLNGSLTTSGVNPLTITTTGITNVTLPLTGTMATLAGAETLSNKTLTSPAINIPTIIGGTYSAIAGLGIRDTSAAFDVTLAATSSSALTAGRSITFDVVNASRTVKLSSNLTIATDPGSITGAIKSNGTGTFSQAACADLSNATTACSTLLGTSGATIGLLSTANIYGAAQTFPASGIKLTGSSTGITTFASANSGASNFTITVPALTANLITSGDTGTVSTGMVAGSAISYAKMQNAVSGYSLVGNTASSAGVLSDFTIGGLTQKASPAGTDLVLIQDQASSGQLKFATIAAVSTAGSVTSIGMAIGAITLDDSLQITGVQLGQTAAVHGHVNFANNGSANAGLIIPYNGNGVMAYCTTTSAWKTLKIPPDIAITNVANNGSGLIRVTHAVTTRPFVSGQWVYIFGVVGVTAANETWAITNVTSTTFDLVSSTFSGTYTSGGTIHGSVAFRRDNITINGVANQTMANLTINYLGLQYLDAACTVGTIVSRTTGKTPSMVTGFNVLNNDLNTTFLAACNPMAGSIQGDGSHILCASWYNRGRATLAVTPTGSTAAGPTLMTGCLYGIIWPDDTAPAGISLDITDSVTASVTAYAAIQPQGSANTFGSGASNYYNNLAPVHVYVPFSNVQGPENFYTYCAGLQTNAGTAALAVVNQSNIVAAFPF